MITVCGETNEEGIKVVKEETQSSDLFLPPVEHCCFSDAAI
jgi:hypothetical protein